VIALAQLLADHSLVDDPAVDLLALVVTRGLRVRFRSKKLGVELFEVGFHRAIPIVFRTTARNSTGVGYCMHVRVVGGKSTGVDYGMRFESVAETTRGSLPHDARLLLQDHTVDHVRNLLLGVLSRTVKFKGLARGVAVVGNGLEGAAGLRASS
jgi:hypothetical protein